VIHQLLPDMVYGDAISNQALAIRDYLRQNGYQSDIFVKRREERMRESALLFDETKPDADAGLFYHHSIGSELTAYAVSHAGPRCLIYHNITPAHYFAPYRPGFAWMLETGRASLRRLAPHFDVSVGDSAYNARELEVNRFKRPGVLPIVINPDRWNIAPDEAQLRRLLDGRHNILFTGRIAPNKKQDRLVEAFSHYQKLDPGSRLIIAGEGRPSDPYFQQVLETIRRLKLEPAVEVTGTVDEETLLAYYRASHLYWSFSEHEGFGAPLVEAMWFDMPVLAFACTAVAETLDDAGKLFSAADELPDIAQCAFELISNHDLRRSTIEKQRIRRQSFTPIAVWPILAELIERLSIESLRTAIA
jgi:glycosyltransferase involved in cell wall biosynthesis